MDKHHIFVYEDTFKDALSTANDIYDYLLSKTKPLYQVGLFIHSDILTVRVGSSIEDVDGFLFHEIFNVPKELKSDFDSFKIDGGILAPFSGTVYDYIDCLISHVNKSGKGLPPGYFEQVASILKGGENSEDTGV